MRILITCLTAALLCSVPAVALSGFDIIVDDEPFDSMTSWVLPNLADLTPVISAQVTGACNLAHDSFMEHINQSAPNTNALAILDFRQSKRPQRIILR